MNTCQEKFSVDETHLCAGGEKGKDSCSGDSGGGLFSEVGEGKWQVVGIVSYGSKRCGNGTPGVYTRVSQYLQWIEQTMNQIFVDSKSVTEDNECDSDHKCLPSADCQYYQEQQTLLKTLTGTLRANLIQELRKLICNRKERAICCPKL